MLVQMLTERVANGGSYNLTFGESLVMSGIGILVVFMELIILALIVMLMGKIIPKLTGKKVTRHPLPKPLPLLRLLLRLLHRRLPCVPSLPATMF